VTAWRLISVALVAAALALGVSACGDSGSGGDTAGAAATSGAPSTKGVKVGYSTVGNDEFQLIEQKQAVDQIQKQGMHALQPVSANKDAGKQLSDIQSLVSAGAKAMMVVPTDSSAIKPALDFLDSKGIPTVSIDIAPVGAKVSMIVRADNYKMGEDGCKQMGAWLKGKGTVLSMQGDYRTTNGKDRGEGFKDCMDKMFPDIKVIERPTDWLPDKAAQVANTEVVNNKQLDGIYMASDTIMLAPVLSALKKAGRDTKVGEPAHVYLISIDGSPFGLQQIRGGKLDALLSQPLDLYAKYGVSYLKQALEGKSFEAGPTDHDSRIVLVGGNPQDLLPAPLVTKDNASDPSLWGNAK
jgi:ribose transport system substrate-binding protein